MPSPRDTRKAVSAPSQIRKKKTRISKPRRTKSENDISKLQKKQMLDKIKEKKRIMSLSLKNLRDTLSEAQKELIYILNEGYDSDIKEYFSRIPIKDIVPRKNYLSLISNCIEVFIDIIDENREVRQEALIKADKMLQLKYADVDPFDIDKEPPNPYL
tara:strand:+ start:50 stop:523 length:474 start_codon:yes stop_codon:yes gene_type:complete